MTERVDRITRSIRRNGALLAIMPQAQAETFVRVMAREINRRLNRDYLGEAVRALGLDRPHELTHAGPRHTALGALLPTVTS